MQCEVSMLCIQNQGCSEVMWWTWVSIARDTPESSHLLLSTSLVIAYLLLPYFHASCILLCISICAPDPHFKKLSSTSRARVFLSLPVNQFQRTLNCMGRLSQQWPYFLVPTFCISYFFFAVAKYPTGSNWRSERFFLAFRLECRLGKAWWERLGSRFWPRNRARDCSCSSVPS